MSHPFVLTVDDPAIKNLLPDGGSPLSLFPVPVGDISGSAAPPIDFNFYVGTQTPPTETPDGSIGKPFPTLSAALAVGNLVDDSATVTYFLTTTLAASDSPDTVNTAHRNVFVSLAGATQVHLALDGTTALNSGVLQRFEGVYGTIVADDGGSGRTGAWMFDFPGTAVPTVEEVNLSFTATFATDFGTGVLSIRGGQMTGILLNLNSVTTVIDGLVCSGGSVITSAPTLISNSQLSNMGFSNMSSLGFLNCPQLGSNGFVAANPGDSVAADLTSAAAWLAGGSTVAGGGVFVLLNQAIALGYGSNSNVQVELQAVELELWQFGENSDAGGGPLTLNFNVPVGATIHVFAATDGTHTATVADDVNGSYGADISQIIDAANGRTVAQFSFVNAAGAQTAVTVTPTAGNASSAIAVFVIVPGTGPVDGFSGNLQNAPGVAPDAVTTGPAPANTVAPVFMCAMCIDTLAPVAPLPGNGLRSWVVCEGGGDGPGFTAVGGAFLTTGWGFGGLATTRFAIGTFKTLAVRAATFTTGQPVDSFISMMAQYPAATPP
jgi:hypothetical protein